jgi:hypothetical protein
MGINPGYMAKSLPGVEILAALEHNQQATFRFFFFFTELQPESSASIERPQLK